MESVTVAQLCRTSHFHALVLHKDTALQDIIKELTTKNAQHDIFLVDDEDQLVATLSHHEVLGWICLRPKIALNETFASIGQLRRLAGAERAFDLAVPEIGQTAVTMEDTLSIVVQKMVEHHLTIIPVVEDNGRLVNDLHWREVLLFLRHSARSADI